MDFAKIDTDWNVVSNRHIKHQITPCYVSFYEFGAIVLGKAVKGNKISYFGSTADLFRVSKQFVFDRAV